METELKNYLTVFPVENSDNSDITKKWELGVRYHNNNWCDWKICYPREVSCRPLRLKLFVITRNIDTTDNRGVIGNEEISKSLKTRLYPSCSFINMPDKYKTISPGETYDHIIDITPWILSKELWGDFKGKERVECTFSVIVTYPHVHYYSVGGLKWKGWY